MRKDAEVHRKMLIEAAADVLASEGYRVPLEAVISKAKLGRGTMYRNFRDREAIVIAVLEHVLGELSDFFIENRNSVTLFRDFMALRALMGVRHFAATTDLKDQVHSIAAVRQRADRLYATVLETVRIAGQVNETLNLAQMSMINRVLILTAREAPDRPPEDVISELLDIVIAGLRPR